MSIAWHSGIGVLSDTSLVKPKSGSTSADEGRWQYTRGLRRMRSSASRVLSVASGIRLGNSVMTAGRFRAFPSSCWSLPASPGLPTDSCCSDMPASAQWRPSTRWKPARRKLYLKPPILSSLATSPESLRTLLCAKRPLAWQSWPSSR